MQTPTKRVLIIQGHPDIRNTHLCHALAQAYANGAAAAGHQVDILTLAELDYPMLRSQQDWLLGAAGLPASLCEAERLLSNANHVAFFFPLWMGTMPAQMKGFLEQIIRPGIAVSEASGKLTPLFSEKSARIVSTMSMPGLAYRWFYKAHGIRNFERNILRLTGIRRIKANYLGLVDKLRATRCKRWLRKMHRLGEAAR